MAKRFSAFHAQVIGAWGLPPYALCNTGFFVTLRALCVLDPYCMLEKLPEPARQLIHLILTKRTQGNNHAGDLMLTVKEGNLNLVAIVFHFV